VSLRDEVDTFGPYFNDTHRHKLTQNTLRQNRHSHTNKTEQKLPVCSQELRGGRIVISSHRRKM